MCDAQRNTGHLIEAFKKTTECDILGFMRYEIQFTDHALQDYLDLTARWRGMVKQAIETHLRHEPRRESKSRIKRLKGIDWPEYRLRVDELRVFYQVEGTVVQILAVVFKDEAEKWLTTFGKPTN